MDLNALFSHHQISLILADDAMCSEERRVQQRLTNYYAERISSMQRASGATFALAPQV